MNKEQKEKNSGAVRRGTCRTSYFLLLTSRQGGFALLFAVIASGILASIAIAIFNLSLREALLSSFGRESQMAFYAADSGAECALYSDIKLGAFAANRFSTPAGSIACGGEVASVTITAMDDTSATSIASFTFGDLCTDIIVAKSRSAGVLRTTLESRGHSTCDTASPVRVERALRITY